MKLKQSLIKEFDYDSWKAHNPVDDKLGIQDWIDSLSEDELEDKVYKKIAELSNDDEVDTLVKILVDVTKKNHMSGWVSNELSMLVQKLMKDWKQKDITYDIFEMYQDEWFEKFISDQKHVSKYDQDNRV